MKTSLKQIKNFDAIDITTISSEEMKKLYSKEKSFDTIVESFGMYGITGVVIQGRITKTLYKITARTTNIFMI